MFSQIIQNVFLSDRMNEEQDAQGVVSNGFREKIRFIGSNNIITNNIVEAMIRFF